MVSDSELVEQLREVLRTADLTTTTTAIVRRSLEVHFGVDLSDRKAFIREQVDLYFQNQHDCGGEEGVEEAEEDGGDGNEGEDEAEEGDDEEDGEGTNKRKSTRKKRSEKSEKNAKRRGGGFTKLCSLSPQLQKFIGEAELARTQVVKQIWAYIRENKLQDPSNRRKIICDERLHELFNVKTIDMFQMNKVLAKHIWPLESETGLVNSNEKQAQQRKAKDEADVIKSKEKEKRDETESSDEDESPVAKKRKKSGKSGFLAPLPLSDALMKFLGTGESALPRPDVVKRMWEYFKKNNLQDPSDKRRIICDAKLKELVEVDTFLGFAVLKLLAPHFIKSEQ